MSEKLMDLIHSTRNNTIVNHNIMDKALKRFLSLPFGSLEDPNRREYHSSTSESICRAFEFSPDELDELPLSQVFEMICTYETDDPFEVATGFTLLDFIYTYLDIKSRFQKGDPAVVTFMNFNLSEYIELVRENSYSCDEIYAKRIQEIEKDIRKFIMDKMPGHNPVDDDVSLGEILGTLFTISQRGWRPFFDEENTERYKQDITSAHQYIGFLLFMLPCGYPELPENRRLLRSIYLLDYRHFLINE